MKSYEDEKNIDLLPILPEEMYGDLRIAIMHPRVKGYFLVAKIFRANKGISLARLIATRACKLVRAIKDQEIFHENQSGRGMYFLCEGVFDLICADHTKYSIGPEKEEPYLPPDGFVVNWVSEFALQMEWLHKDRLVACRSGEVLLYVCS